MWVLSVYVHKISGNKLIDKGPNKLWVLSFSSWILYFVPREREMEVLREARIYWSVLKFSSRNLYLFTKERVRESRTYFPFKFLNIYIFYVKTGGWMSRLYCQNLSFYMNSIHSNGRKRERERRAGPNYISLFSI